MITIFGCATLLALAAAPPAVKQGKAPPQKLLAQKTPAKKVAKKSPTSGAQVLVDRVQDYYKDLQDYSADFIQTYTRVALSKTSESRGELLLKKPGLMRWAYSKPAEKLWVVDGKKLWVADPEEMQVFVDENYKSTELTTSIQFLWGAGKLTDSFKAKLGENKTYGAPAGSGVLELTPKTGATFAKLVLVVDKNTGAVQSSTIFETAGNTNHFKFTNVRLNRGIPVSTFMYTPPPTWEVIHR